MVLALVNGSVQCCHGREVTRVPPRALGATLAEDGSFCHGCNPEAFFCDDWDEVELPQARYHHKYAQPVDASLEVDTLVTLAHAL